MYEDTNWKQTNPVVQDLQNESAQKNQRSTGQFWSCCFPPGAHNLKVKDTPKNLLEMRTFARNARCFFQCFLFSNHFEKHLHCLINHIMIHMVLMDLSLHRSLEEVEVFCSLSQLFGGLQNTSPLDFVKTIGGFCEKLFQKLPCYP